MLNMHSIGSTASPSSLSSAATLGRQSISKGRNHGRVLRKGTHSCIECKRRKMRCVFNGASVCRGCSKRQTSCISQQFAEDFDASSKVDADADIHESNVSKNERLSSLLHKSLPSEEDTRRIYDANPHSMTLHAHDLMTMPYTHRGSQVTTRRCSYDRPSRTEHPVLIARHMLLLASCLQHLDSDVQTELQGLSEAPHDMAVRLANLAHDIVTSKDDLLGSIEGLECIMIESVYHANAGDISRSWLTNRRAVNIAILMGLNRKDDRGHFKTIDRRTAGEQSPKRLWSRVVFLDRFLCLLLGHPQACNSPNMSTHAVLTDDVPMERLERIHCMIAARILERNASDMDQHDLAFTRTLDVELQQAARDLPSKWWLVPSSATGQKPLFEDTGRLFAHILHYNLLNQLHVPYMFFTTSSLADYSRAMCITASREVITRFLALRGFNSISSSCRITEVLALMAAITLLLAQLDGRSSENLIAHQFHSDRAMIEQVQEIVAADEGHLSRPLAAQSMQSLQKLLAVNTDTDGSGPESTSRISVQHIGPDASLPELINNSDVSTTYVPYLGIIRITSARTEMASNGDSNALANTACNRDDGILGAPLNGFGAEMSTAPGMFTSCLPQAQQLSLGDWSLGDIDMTMLESGCGAGGR